MKQKKTKKTRHKTSKKNLFLVCNYRTFRGFEHLKITVAEECYKYFWNIIYLNHLSDT